MHTIQEFTIVKGRSATGERIQLSVLDLLIGHLNMAGVYFFQSVPDLPKLKRALAETLDLFPSFGASLVRENGGFYIHQNNTGIGLTVVHCTEPSTDPQYTGPIMLGNPLIDDGLPFEYQMGSGEPVVFLRLTIFADQCCALTLRFIHSLTDGAGMSRFMQAWSAHYRGLEPPAASHADRSFMKQLAAGDGARPSRKFDLRSASEWPVSDRIEVDPADFDVCYVDIEKHLLAAAVQSCRARSALALSSSDIVHALAWKAFARSIDIDANQVGRLHTIFDIRAVAGLSIPENFEGNALFERGAAIALGTLRKLQLHEIAELYNRQVKPLEAGDVRQDIAFLERELAERNIDSDSGRFVRFLRASMVDCMAPSALFINDMRLLKSAEVAFEDRTHRYETAISLGRNFVFVYDRAGSITFLYTGRKSSTRRFAEELRGLAATFDIDTAAAMGQ